VTPAPGDFGERYGAAFLRYLDEPGEEALSAAYELGRSAVAQQLSVLDLAVTHHDAIGRAVEALGADRAQEVVAAAGVFFREALSAFDMVQRVLQEAREAAAAERRQTATLRRLSTFLADASIAVDAADSTEEILQLVAEHARELIGGRRCVARLRDRGASGPLVAVVAADDADDPAGPDLEALYAAIAAPSGSVRATRAELERHPAVLALDEAAPAAVEGWLAAPLTALDGRALGLIQLFDKEQGEFTALDEELLVQLAQMASAAVERAELYRLRPGGER
jgi:GAF domain-containing protein